MFAPFSKLLPTLCTIVLVGTGWVGGIGRRCARTRCSPRSGRVAWCPSADLHRDALHVADSVAWRDALEERLALVARRFIGDRCMKWLVVCSRLVDQVAVPPPKHRSLLLAPGKMDQKTIMQVCNRDASP